MKKKFNSIGEGQKKILILALDGHGMNLNLFKTRLQEFITMGGCQPTIEVREKLFAEDYVKGHYFMVIGANQQKKFIYDLFKSDGNYCEIVGPGFGGVVQDWWKFSNDPGLADGYAWNAAVISKSSITPSKLRVSSIEKAVAFVVYHELAHLARTWPHTDIFNPNGLLAEARGIYYILGTGNLTSGGELRYKDKYDSLEKLILDPEHIYNSEQHRNHHLKICEKLD